MIWRWASSWTAFGFYLRGLGGSENDDRTLRPSSLAAGETNLLIRWIFRFPENQAPEKNKNNDDELNLGTDHRFIRAGAYFFFVLTSNS